MIPRSVFWKTRMPPGMLSAMVCRLAFSTVSWLLRWARASLALMVSVMSRMMT